jgi:hypothetical protein
MVSLNAYLLHGVFAINHWIHPTGKKNMKKKGESHRKFPEQFEGLYINHSPSFDASHDCAAHFVIFLRGRVAQSHSMD